MKVFWIVNSILNDFSLYLYNKESNGLWMEALLTDFKNDAKHKVVVATSIKTKFLEKYEKDGIVYYGVPNVNPISYNENKKSNIKAWEEVLRNENPDIIQVWGTEFTHGLCALRIAKKLNIPSIIYMQGYLGSIARFYQAGIPYKDLKKVCTFRDFIKRDSILQQQEKYYKSSYKEKEMFALSNGIISENEWCNANIKSIVPTIKTYYCPLSINKVFQDFKWGLQNVEKHSLMCTASGYTIKGLHMVLNAVALLKNKYPDIKVYVPGIPQVSDGSLKWTLRKRGYTKYIETLIKKLGINSNVVWLGVLSQQELAEKYSKTHVFVMSSSIENHSSSLKEAMMVGMPCVSSNVGGISEYLNHGENGFLYRFEEYEMMAKYIENIFEDDALAEKLSNNANKDMLKLHNDNLYQKILHIYEDVKSQK